MKGFAILEVMLIIWVASLIGYGIHTGAIEIVDACPDKEYPHLTTGKVKEYKALEKALSNGGTEALIADAAKTGCFGRIKIVNGREVKNCWGTIKPAYKRTWECEELSRRTAPQCYEEPVDNAPGISK